MEVHSITAKGARRLLPWVYWSRYDESGYMLENARYVGEIVSDDGMAEYLQTITYSINNYNDDRTQSVGNGEYVVLDNSKRGIAPRYSGYPFSAFDYPQFDYSFDWKFNGLWRVILQ